jgi:hypothetical protein
MSKWAMQTHFRNLRFNSFPMMWKTLQGDEFWPLQLCFKYSRVHSGLQLPTWEFTWECEGSCPHTLCTPLSMWSDSRVSLLACNLATPYLGHEPKTKAATNINLTCDDKLKCRVWLSVINIFLTCECEI